MNKDITNHPSALDINEIWAAIEPQVDEINAQRKKRKPVFIYWLSGLALLTGLGIAAFFLLDENSQSSETLYGNLPDNNIRAVAPVVKSSSNNDTDLKTKRIKTKPEVIVPTTTLDTKSTAVETSITAKLNNAIVMDDVSITTLLQQKKVEPTDLSTLVKEGSTMLSPLPFSTTRLTTPNTDSPALNFSIKNNKASIPPPVYIERPTFSIEFQTGISAVNRTLSSTGNSNSDLDTLLGLRNTFEAPLEALHANLLVNAHFPSGLFVSSGVGFTQISERYSNNSTVVDSIVEMGIQKRIINISGDTIDVIGPVTSLRTTTFTKKYYNSYRMIDIPVFVGYQYDFGDWKTDFSLGIFANILLATEGRIPSTPTTDLDLSTNGDDIYRSRVDYSLQFGIGVSKRLTEKLSIRVNPMLRYYSRNFIKEDFGLNQRYLLFGGTVGLRMDL